MDFAKKYLPRTMCVVGLFVFIGLMGCNSTTTEENIYIEPQQQAFAQDDVANPYLDEMPMEQNEAFADEAFPDEAFFEEQGDMIEVPMTPCDQADDGQGITPCALAAQKAAANPAPIIRNKKAYAKSKSVVNIETPVRCEIAGRDDSIISSIPMGPDSFKLIRMDKSDPLPRFEVNNYTFKDKPLDVAIQNLVKEAGIQVFSDDALFPDVSGENIRGELSAVIDELVAAGDTFYRYNATKKQLFLSRWAPFMMKVPGGRIGMYTVLDALRGANITNTQPDFGSNEIYMRINYEKHREVSNLIKIIEQSPNLLLFDVQMYRLTPKSNLDWQEMVQNYGVTRINSSVNGIMGRILSIKQQKVRETLVEMLRRYASVDLVSEGVVIMPNGWKVRFDIGQCANIQSPEQKLSMLFQSNILSADRAESNIALDTSFGEITSFHTVYNMNDTLNIIAVKGKVLNPEWDDRVEYIITLKPKLVRLIK